MHRRHPSLRSGLYLTLLFALLLSTVLPVRAAAPSQDAPPIEPDSVLYLNQLVEFSPPEAAPAGETDLTVSANPAPAGGVWFGSNLILNPGAELASTGGQLLDWASALDEVTAGQYGVGHNPKSTDPGPAIRGSNFFGPRAENCDPDTHEGCNTTAVQTVNLPPGQAIRIDTGGVRFNLSGYFGGVFGDDTARLVMFFLDENGKDLNQDAYVSIGGVTNADRRGKPGLLERSASGYLPKGTRALRLELHFIYDPNQYSGPPSGMADNLSLTMSEPKLFLPALNRSGAPAGKPVEKLAPPAAPEIASAYALDTHTVSLRWVDQSNDESGFRVERQVTGEPNFTVLAYLGPDQTTYIDKDFRIDKNWAYVKIHYRIIAYNSAGDSAAAAVDVTMPPAPQNEPESPADCWISNLSSTSVVFSWEDFSDNEDFFYLEIDFDHAGIYNHLADIEPNATSVTIVDLTPGRYTELWISAVNEVGQSGYCGVYFTPPVETSGIKINNNSSYPVAYLAIDGVQEFPVSPMHIPSGGYNEVLLDPGTHTIEARTGFWQDQTHRFDMYSYYFTVNVKAGEMKEINIEDIAIEQLLTQFNQMGTGYGYWEGTYWDANNNCHTAAFRFYPNKSYKFYIGNREQATGTYQLKGRKPSIYASMFTISNYSGKDAMLIEPYGYFYLENGPANWKQIEYHFKPQGYVANPFCP